MAPVAVACTGIRLTAADGTVLQARTMEFGADLHSNVIVVPRGHEHTATTPDGKPGHRWSSKYAYVGANGFDTPMIVDGINEKGLAVGLFYFPGMAGYQPYRAEDADKTVAAWELGGWMLSNFATVGQVCDALPEIVVPSVEFKPMGISPGVHFIAMDDQGGALVIEYVDGKLNLYDNPVGVLTNDPGFDWHLTNLRNYVKLSPEDAPPLQLGDERFSALGQGSGMLGMPGDYTPPSRFIRAAAFSHSALPVQTGEEAVLQAFHILNNFDIPKGSVRSSQKHANGQPVADETQWTCVCDMKARKFYFRTYDNSQIRSVDLRDMPLDGGNVQTISMQGDEVIQPLVPGGKSTSMASGRGK